jgi:hypothetical protein
MHPDVTKVNEVLATTNYALFNDNESNRDVNEQHLRQLVKSMEQECLQIPIIVNENYEVIDGQHRLLACAELGIPVFFIIVAGYGLAQIQRANNTVRKWKLDDYIPGYVEAGKADYITFQEFQEEYKLGTPNSMCLLSNGLSYGNGRAKDFASGQFTVHNLAQARMFAEQVIDFQNHYKGWKREKFVLSLLHVFRNPNYNHEDMLRKLNIKAGTLRDTTRVDLYLEQLDEIYNYKRKGGRVSLLKNNDFE